MTPGKPNLEWIRKILGEVEDRGARAIDTSRHDVGEPEASSRSLRRSQINLNRQFRLVQSRTNRFPKQPNRARTHKSRPLGDR
jgi:hypothetical protein